MKVKIFCKSLIIVRNWLYFSLWFRDLWREIRLLDLLSIICFGKHNLRLSWIKPFTCVFVSISNINTEPILIMINKMPSSPYQTLYVNITIIDIFNVFSHRTILITVSHLLQYPR